MHASTTITTICIRTTIYFCTTAPAASFFGRRTFKNGLFRSFVTFFHPSVTVTPDGFDQTCQKKVQIRDKPYRGVFFIVYFFASCLFLSFFVHGFFSHFFFSTYLYLAYNCLFTNYTLVNAFLALRPKNAPFAS